MTTVAAILGSAFGILDDSQLRLERQVVGTPFGEQEIHAVANQSAYVIFRHGLPHRLLPHEINYRAQAWALRQLGCAGLLVTSSVGVLDATLPLYQPLLVGDLLMPDNRLPDGSLCTIFRGGVPGKGHLVLEEGLISTALADQVAAFVREDGWPSPQHVVFAYAPGPRGKTPAENRWWAQAGAQVNSMTLGPEVVLANELEIPCAALVVGHKYSLPTGRPEIQDTVAQSLLRSRQAMERIVARFLSQSTPVPFCNQIFRFADEGGDP